MAPWFSLRGSYVPFTHVMDSVAFAWGRLQTQVSGRSADVELLCQGQTQSLTRNPPCKMIWKSLKLQVRWWFVQVEVHGGWCSLVVSGHHSRRTIERGSAPQTRGCRPFTWIQRGREEEYSPAVRVSMCQGGPRRTMCCSCCSCQR